MYEKRVHINYGVNLTIPAGTQVGVFTDSACTVLATIYANDGVTPAVNPVIVDANGEFSYRAANGVYFEKIGTEPAAELRFNDGSQGVGTISQETIDAINELLANPPTGTMSGLLAARPVASVDYRGMFYNVEGAGDDGEDVLTVCMLSPGGASYSWRISATTFGSL